MPADYVFMLHTDQDEPGSPGIQYNAGIAPWTLEDARLKARKALYNLSMSDDYIARDTCVGEDPDDPDPNCPVMWDPDTGRILAWAQVKRTSYTRAKSKSGAQRAIALGVI